MKESLVARLSDTRSRMSLMRTPEMAALARIEGAMLAGARKAFEEQGYTEILVPSLTKATGACENFDTLFEVDYFGKQAYLSQTGQLYLEAFVPMIDKVCCIGPSFRAEPEADNRHLTQFALLEIEHRGDLAKLKSEIEKIIARSTMEVVGKRAADLELLGVDGKSLERSVELPFRSMSYEEAVGVLAPAFGMRWGDDLRSQHEHYLVKYAGERPLFVTHFPEKIKFFNMRTNREDARVVNSMDLLLPYGGETVGSAEREEDFARLEKRLASSYMLEQIAAKKIGNGEWENLSMREAKEQAVEIFRWYLDFVKENPVRHAGCGIGGTRLMQFLLECPDIRAATTYPLNRESIL